MESWPEEASWIVIFMKVDGKCYIRNPRISRWSMFKTHQLNGIHCLYTTIFVEDWDKLSDDMKMQAEILTTAKEAKLIDLGGVIKCGPTR